MNRLHIYSWVLFALFVSFSVMDVYTTYTAVCVHHTAVEANPFVSTMASHLGGFLNWVPFHLLMLNGVMLFATRQLRRYDTRAKRVIGMVLLTFLVAGYGFVIANNLDLVLAGALEGHVPELARAVSSNIPDEAVLVSRDAFHEASFCGRGG